MVDGDGGDSGRDEELTRRLECLRDAVEAIGADDIVTPKEYAFLRQSIVEQSLALTGESPDTLARHALRLFAPAARAEAIATFQVRVAKLKASVDGVCSDGVVSLQEVEFLKKKALSLQIVRPNETVEQIVRAALQPLLGRVKIEAAAQAALGGARAACVAPVTVIVTPDGMEARVIVEQGQRWSSDDLMRAFADARVVHGIDPRCAAGRLPVAVAGTTVVLARGTAPGFGPNREVTWEFPMRQAVSVNHEERNSPVVFDADALIIPHLIVAGAVIAAISPVVFGPEGLSVRGEPTAGLPGPPARLFAGRGAQLSEDGLRLEASESGSLFVNAEGVISVHPVLQVVAGHAPVDVAHNGSVIVRGDVGPGSRILAVGDVLIEGSLEEANVRAGGNVVVRQGLFRQASVSAAGDVVVRSIVGASRIEACGNVFVLADAVGSQIEGGDIVSVAGSVAGGRVRARAIVEADTFALGSASDTHIEVRVPLPPGGLSLLRARKEELQQQAGRARGALSASGAMFGGLKGARKKTLSSPPSPEPPGRDLITRIAIRSEPRGTPSMMAPPRGTPSMMAAPKPPPPISRTPPLSLAALRGDEFRPLTTAAAIGIDVNDDVAIGAEVDIAIADAQMAAFAANSSPIMARALARNAFCAGVRLTIGSSDTRLASQKTSVVAIAADGFIAYRPAVLGLD